MVDEDGQFLKLVILDFEHFEVSDCENVGGNLFYQIKVENQLLEIDHFTNIKSKYKLPNVLRHHFKLVFR